MVHQDIFKGKWKEVKGKIKEEWGKITDDDLKVIDGRREQLLGKLQQKYGWAKDKAEQKLKEFENNIASDFSDFEERTEHDFKKHR